MVDYSLLNKSFKGKKVFLTGHTGFKGTWLTIWLQMMGAEVKGYALKPEKESLFNQVKTQLKIDSVIADIRNRNRIEKEILDFQPDFIFHLAAQPLVRLSYQIPMETFDVNVTGTMNVLNGIRTLKKNCTVVVITTDKVYENNETGKPFAEKDALGGLDPYSASKAAAEIVTQSYRHSFFHPTDFKTHKKSIATARAGNVIGGGDYAADRLLPDIFKALREEQEIIIRNPNSTRPWQFVLEPLAGYLQLAVSLSKNKGNFCEAYNFGPKVKDVMNVEQVVKTAIKTFGSGTYKVIQNKQQPHEAKLLSLDIKKAATQLNWEPVLNATSAIQRTMAWYKHSMQKNIDVYQLCVQDINHFIAHS
jgi:CDP-glucose 4,6-dehydratase